MGLPNRIVQANRGGSDDFDDAKRLNDRIRSVFEPVREQQFDERFVEVLFRRKQSSVQLKFLHEEHELVLFRQLNAVTVPLVRIPKPSRHEPTPSVFCGGRYRRL